MASAIDRPRCELLSAPERLKADGTRCPIVIVTAFPEFDTSFDAGEAGADGYVEDLLFGDDLLECRVSSNR